MQPEKRGLRAIPAVCGGLTATVGIAVLIGWSLDVPVLQRVARGFVAMKVNTAICLVLSGVSLVLLHPIPAPAKWLTAGRAMAALVLGIAAITLCEFAFDWNAGIDELLFTDPAVGDRTAAPGRMALPTAIAFVLIALGLLGLNWELRRFLRPADGCAALALFLAVTSPFQHAFSTPLFDAEWGLTPMALHTAPAILLLAVGLLWARPEQGVLGAFRESVRSPLERRIYAVVSVSLAGMMLGGIFSYFSANESIIRARWVDHSHEARRHLVRLLSALQDLETGQRGFVISGDAAFLDPYEIALSGIDDELAALRALTSDNPGQAERLGKLEKIAREKAEFARETVVLRRERGLAAAAALVATGEGRMTMDAARAVIRAMDAEEARLLGEREREEYRSMRQTNAVIAAGAVFALGVVLFAMGAIRRGFRLAREAEEKLRESEENLAVTLRSIGDGVLTTDLRGRVTGLNPVAESLTGWSSAEAAGKPVNEVFRIVHEHTRQPARVPVDEVLSTGEMKGLANHTILIARGGAEHPIADSAAPIRDEEGRLRGVVLVFRDVTAEREAADERDRFFNLSLDILCIASSNGHFTRVSPSFSRILGWSEEELLNTPFIEFVHPEDHAATLAEVERQVKRGEPVLKFENRYRHKDGSWRTLAWKSVPVGGRFMYATARDVTDARAAEREIEEREVLLRCVLNSIVANIAVLDHNGSVISQNERWLSTALERHGAPAAQRAKIDASYPETIEWVMRGLPGGAQEAASALKEILAGARSECEWEYASPDTGEPRWHSVHISRLNREEGGAVVVHTDITVRKRAEAEILQKSQALEAANQQLHAANAELESFSYSVSHDLRAPLRHIQGYGEMLQKAAAGQLPEKAARYLNTILETSAEMGHLIDDLLAFSRMGRAELRLENVSLEEIVKDVLRNMDLAIRDRSIVWKIDPLPVVRGDPPMLKQVFTNLLDNAVKYTGTRPVAEIEVGCTGRDNGRFVLFVRDNGVGFDMRYVQKLFGVFQRLHRSDEFEGTGIGLAIVRRIIARHGGKTWAEGELDKGAAIHFTLEPAVKEQI